MTLRMRLPVRYLLPVAAIAAMAASAQPLAGAVLPGLFENAPEARRALAEARAQGAAARTRAEQLEANARRATAAADRTAREAAAVAARIQQTQAEIAAHRLRIGLIARERAQLRTRLAARQLPLVRLTAALQRLSRRPPGLALLRPGSVRDTVHLRALLDTMLPEVERRTRALRAEIGRGRALERRADLATRELGRSQASLKQRRQALAVLETRQRLAQRQIASIADREAERALALAEEARDLDELAARLGEAGALRERLSRLPGPIMRPPRPQQSQVLVADAFAPTARTLSEYVLPVSGRLVTGFGAEVEGRPRSRGIALVAQPGAQVVAPAGGRIAFAGPYRGYGQIVIIEHDGGWTTLVTGLAQLDARVGDSLVAGSPLGLAGAGTPIVSVELRQNGVPVNPLQFVRPL